MAVSVRPLLAIGLASAGIGVAFAVAAAPLAAAAPAKSGTSNTSTNHWSYDKGSRQLVRNSTNASPTGAFTAKTASWSKVTSSFTRGGVLTSYSLFVTPSGGETQGGAVKHHQGTHHSH